ncbi:hypothetical protein ABEV34_18980, partial [Methylorubrum rhodesianum]|uniref:hypothetical protein n=1 Tax=Methylorubrum rhodesianum TaxID=29427 RepID=UPI003D2BF727
MVLPDGFGPFEQVLSKIEHAFGSIRIWPATAGTLMSAMMLAISNRPIVRSPECLRRADARACCH